MTLKSKNSKPNKCPKCGESVCDCVLNDVDYLRSKISKLERSLPGGKSRRPAPQEGGRKHDYYTPLWAIEALLDCEQFAGRTWEPACGDGRIVDAFKRRGLNCYGSDITDGTDFVKSTAKVANVVTNPPFELKREFVSHAKECASEKIAMLLEVNVLKEKCNQPLWRDDLFPFARIWILVGNVKFQKAGSLEDWQSWHAYAWFVWDHSHKGPPTVHWLA